MTAGRFTSYVLLVAGVAAISPGCNSTYSASAGARYLYDYESAALHPQYLIYHHAEEYSTLWLQLPAHEALFTRSESAAPFEARFELRYTIQTLIDNKRMEIVDSGRVSIRFMQEDQPEFLVHQINMPMQAGRLYRLECRLTDQNRNTTELRSVQADKTSRWSAQNFLCTDALTGTPLFGSAVPSGQRVKVQSLRLSNTRLRALQLADEVKLPPPPFSGNSPELPLPDWGKPIALAPDSTGGYTFTAQSGLYFISAADRTGEGISLLTSNQYFPEVRAVAQMIGPLRYITSKAEYDEIEKSKSPKQLIDNFWIECAGNRDRARDLIRIYYNRVREANHYFTTYTEGWRTDRGMVHLVFGQPNRIYKDSDSETWLYGEEGNISSLQFVFRLAESPFSTRVYVLNRDPVFRSYWERAVTAWRNGKIFSE